MGKPVKRVIWLLILLVPPLHADDQLKLPPPIDQSIKHITESDMASEDKKAALDRAHAAHEKETEIAYREWAKRKSDRGKNIMTGIGLGVSAGLSAYAAVESARKQTVITPAP